MTTRKEEELYVKPSRSRVHAKPLREVKIIARIPKSPPYKRGNTSYKRGNSALTGAPDEGPEE